MTNLNEYLAAVDVMPEEFPMTRSALKTLIHAAYRGGYIDGITDGHKVCMDAVDNVMGSVIQNDDSNGS